MNATELVMGEGTEARKAAGACPSCGKRTRYYYRRPGGKWKCGTCHRADKLYSVIWEGDA